MSAFYVSSHKDFHMYHKIKFDKVKTFSYGFEHPVLLVCVFMCNLRSVKMKGRIMIVDYCACVTAS